MVRVMVLTFIGTVFVTVDPLRRILTGTLTVCVRREVLVRRVGLTG